MMNAQEPTALIDRYDSVLCDLDGVVYKGSDAVPYAVESLNRVQESGRKVGYITNNASRTPHDVANQLRALGLHVADGDVINSAQAGATLLAAKVPAGSPVLVVGGHGLSTAVTEVGLVPVHSGNEKPVAVIQGFSPDLGWHALAEASFVLEQLTVVDPENVHWVATNTDMTIPQERGIAPGNGTMVAAVRMATGLTPEVAGKPQAAIFTAATQRLGVSKPLMIGDRLDTDIAGGNKAGIDTALVLTGISTAEELKTLENETQPTYVIDTLADLFKPGNAWKNHTIQN